MLAIFKREIRSFFTSSIGYLVVGLFLVLTGLFLWVFKGPYNIFDAGFAELSNFFLLVPWIFLFLIPAITMKSFSEERKMGTLELLFIKPISLWETVLGKFFGNALLAIIALMPTLIYVYVIWQLGTTSGNLDMGVVWGSYFGLLFLVCAYTAIGVFCSSLTSNQIVSFIVAAGVSFLLYYGFEGIASLTGDGSLALQVKNLGMKAHFDSVARGILDLQDLVYFMSITLFFLYLTTAHLKNLSR